MYFSVIFGLNCIFYYPQIYNIKTTGNWFLTDTMRKFCLGFFTFYALCFTYLPSFSPPVALIHRKRIYSEGKAKEEATAPAILHYAGRLEE